MNDREFGRTRWRVSEIGCGMWGMGSWSNSSDEESLRSLQAAIDRGCTFFDTAYAYGEGRSEALLGQVVRANEGRRLYTATKIPPKNMKWPARSHFTIDDCYPPDHIEEYLHKSLKNAGLESFDLVQLHTWEDSWVDDDLWVMKIDELRQQGLLQALGISEDDWLKDWPAEFEVRFRALCDRRIREYEEQQRTHPTR